MATAASTCARLVSYEPETVVVEQHSGQAFTVCRGEG
jgi:hypothetical protein